MTEEPSVVDNDPKLPKKLRKEKKKAKKKHKHHDKDEEEKKSSKRKRSRSEDDEEEEGEENVMEDPAIASSLSPKQEEKGMSKKLSADERKEARKRRKQEKEDALSKVPKVDEHGIKYTKIQIRRMMKRVKRGLTPVPTAAEERERLQRERELQKEEEAELAGMLYKKPENNKPIVNEGDQTDEDESDDDDDEGNDSEREGDNDMETEKTGGRQPEETTVQRDVNTGNKASNKKKARRSKPVPDDYVCLACQNAHKPVHWIYDCPDKVTMKGTNQKSKKYRGLNEPDAKKVFVSGLPFDVKPKDVEGMFTSCGKVKSCKLLKFDDTGRCKGQAYITFDTEDAAKQAIKLSGTTIDNNDGGSGKKKKKQKEQQETKRKQLTLKVSKVLNRRASHTSKT